MQVKSYIHPHCLYRDSTVQTLTLQPSVQCGKVTYQDSPLVNCQFVIVQERV